MAIIGPSESQAVRVGGNLYEKAGLAAVSGSATAVDLTKGRPYTTFFRVNPNDAIQAPQIVAFVTREPERQERRRHRLAGRLLDPACERDLARPPREERDGRSRVRVGGRHRLLVDRGERRERRERRRLRDAGCVGGEHALEPAPRAGQEGDRLRNRRRVLAVAVQAEDRVRVGLRSGSALRPQGPRARPRVQPVLEEQVVRRLRPGDLHGRARGDERHHEGLRQRPGDASRGDDVRSPDEHPVDLRRHGSLLSERAIRCRRGSASTRSRTGSTARSASTMAHAIEQPVSTTGCSSREPRL